MTNHPIERPLAATVSEPTFPLPRGAIWGICAVVPLAGSVLYYAWKRTHPAAARYANRTSWICWGMWIAALYTWRSLLT
jgi:hypothetical protein